MKLRSVSKFTFVVSLMSLVFSVPVRAGGVDTVDWATAVTTGGGMGTGSGTLAGGTIAVTYTTVFVGGGNSPSTIGENWTSSPATSGAVPGGVTNELGGVLGTTLATSPLTQTITFSHDVSNVILLVNFSDADSSMNFGSLPITLLSSNNASLSGDIVTFAGSSNGSNDGFAASIGGVFGPQNSLTFTYSTQGTGNDIHFDSVGFTVAAQSVPEPSTLVLGSTAIAVGAGLTWLRRRHRRGKAVSVRSLV